ncbi:MAG: DUF2169 domain-containing protein [Campylobacterota bacterium]|nr:DUF2169 domain-containing protein [Campylobacterota bacterium]
MKIIKDTKTSLLLKSFLLNNQDYLSISILCYFDFNNPDAFLEEQAMYKESSQELGKTILDYAMPKPKAEVLLSGSCHNPLENETSSHVKLKVGEISRELYVFGKREWRNGLITKPLAFKTIPLDFAHAIAIDENHLPHVEDPKNLVTSKYDNIAPASFMPKDINSKENMKKLGSYDESWKIELWPGFASDMDYSFFNLSSKEQQQDKFFKGGENIELTNMHPKHPVITSHIPQTSMRCFATREHKDKDDEFVEVKLQRDTLWLFPEIQRGIVIFRGTIEIADEIYSDLKYLNLKPIEIDEPLKSLQEYYELQKKELDKSIEFDETPFEEADAKIAEAKKEVFDIPRQVKEGVEKTQGKRPTLKRDSADKIEQSHARIDKAIAKMDNAKIKLQEMKDEFGHIMKIDVNVFDEAKEDLLSSKQKLSDALEKSDNAVKNSKQMKLDALADIEKIKNNPKIPDEAKAKIEFDFLKEREKIWSDYAFDFLSECVKALEKEPDELHKLRHFGLAKRTIPRAWIGFSSEAKTIKADEWRLDSEDDIELPKGIVTARFEEAILKSLRINDTLILGSDEDYELFLSEENYNFPLFYFKDDIEAYLCDQEAFDICNTLVCDDVSSVGDGAKEALEKASVIFYLKKDGVIEKFPNAKVFDCSEYKNLFELHQNGVEIREQIIQNLPKDMLDTLPIERDISAKAIGNKSREIAQKVKVDLKAKAKKLKEELESERDKMLAKANETLAKRGLDPIDANSHVKSDGFIKSSEVTENFDKAIVALKKKDGVNGVDIKDKIVELQKAKEEMVTLALKGEKMYEAGVVKIAAAKERAKEIANDPIPKWAKEKMQEAGIDPENPHDVLTREKVIAYYAEKKSFKNKNLSDLDLSELDLSGIDLTTANLTNTNLTNSNLSGANFEQTNCTKTDFTKTNLSDVKASMSIFKESVIEKTIFNRFEADMALFEAVTFKDAKFKDAVLNGIVFKGIEIQNSSFENCSLLNATFLKTSIKKSSFDNSKMDKTLFSESTIDECELVGIDSEAMLFNKSKVTNCDFSQSRLYNMRILKFSEFKKCDLSNCDMDSTTIFEVSLDECNLQQTTLNKSLIKKSELNRCDFRGVVAKQGRFEFSRFIECPFNGIDLMRGSLRGMDIKICDFSNSNLYAVEMYKTKLFEVKLDGANLKRSNLEGRVEFIYE